MRIVLVVPTRRDPAHRRVLEALRREYERAGDRVTVFSHPDAARLERRLQEADVCHIQFFSRGLGYLERVRFPPRIKLILTHQGASMRLLEHPEVFARLARRADFITSVSREGLGEIRKRFVPHHLSIGSERPGPLPPPSSVIGRGGPIQYEGRGPRTRDGRLRAKSVVIPNGTDMSKRPSKAAPKAPFILSVARLAAYKGSDILLMAYAGLEREGRPRLVLCGPDQSGGRVAGFLDRLGLRGDVRLLGEVDFKTVSRLLRDCRFFVLASRRENLPMALLEAMAAGKAVVASKAGGIGEIIEDGKNGLLVEPEDVDALSRSMRRLIDDGGLRSRLGRQARRRARDFSWSAVARRYRGLYA